MGNPGTVFLMYHELSVPDRKLCYSEPGYTRYVISASCFREQMQKLARESFIGKSVGQVIADFDKNLDNQSVAVTFDDGCETDLICAAPVLKELGFSATFYITAGFVGKPGYLSKSQVHELSNLGFEIGCHSMTHPYMTDISAGQLREETAGARESLEQMSGSPVIHFSYPGGRGNASVAEAVRGAGFQSIATSSSGINSARTNPSALHRVPILEGTNLEQFTCICRGQGLRWARLKEKARDASKRALGNSAYESVRSLLLGKGKNPK
jgi:peptidoglycan/xylan/chitin deacetylase (PgdA/CDA1 family)